MVYRAPVSDHWLKSWDFAPGHRIVPRYIVCFGILYIEMWKNYRKRIETYRKGDQSRVNAFNLKPGAETASSKQEASCIVIDHDTDLYKILKFL